jgi:ABC-type phosphonate transport system ATPase subunit
MTTETSTITTITGHVQDKPQFSKPSRNRPDIRTSFKVRHSNGKWGVSTTVSASNDVAELIVGSIHAGDVVAITGTLKCRTGTAPDDRLRTYSVLFCESILKFAPRVVE